MFQIFCQRDKRWADSFLGKTKRTMAAVGCTTTGCSMCGTYFREVILPGELCRKLDYTADALIIWASIGKVFRTMEFEWRFYTYDQARIDAALKHPLKTVLLNVDNGGHWVVALSRIPLTKKFWVADPWDGKRKVYGGVVGGTILRKKA